MSNVNQIEAGNQEPNVILAVKMLLAANADISIFFKELRSQLLHYIEASKIPLIPENEFQEALTAVLSPEDETKLFGMLLYACRKITTLSQNALSSIARYDHRSLQKVEKGIQIPGVVNAVKLVAATGIDTGMFFEIFSKKWKAVHVPAEKKNSLGNNQK